jgi:hypothetical protein
MTAKPHEFIRGNQELLRIVEEQERPEFFVDDATSSMRLPPVESIEAQGFIEAAEAALTKLNDEQQNGDNGHNGPPASPEQTG